MLAGRKLLLADDSATIQKVIALTFADEGMEVVTVGNGLEAIEKVEQLMPDVVLADVYMPELNGYEVCEFIKGTEKLKHIPVMLLVGSFEPLDEAEARRVGANDTLTKPFQSIRRLIQRVGDLVSGKLPEVDVPTAELLPPEPPEEPKLSTAELEITTADTMQLPADKAERAHFISSRQATEPANQMERQFNKVPANRVSEPSESLLDLGDFQAAQQLDAEDFELDLDESAPARTPSVAAYETAQASSVAGWRNQSAAEAPTLYAEPFSQVHEPPYERDYRPALPVEEGGRDQGMPRYATSQLDVNNLPPAVIDAIARRAVEYLSEKVVQEIAWEVVPQLAERLIKRQLEDKESQAK